MKTNQQLQRDVQAELAYEPTIDAASIGVTAADGVVTLAGHVPGYAQKFAAERAAQRVMGVLAVADEIEVRLPLSLKRDDADIAKSALNALQWHVAVPDGVVKVLVKDGWVTLSGEVEWAFQRKAAEKSVRYLRGVTGLSNLITVKPRVEPRDVKAEIEAALTRTAIAEAKQIHIDTSLGKVTLTGHVSSWAERHAVDKAAWAAPGVTYVDNRLTIASPAFV
jgi:osmotically-inducible protein OsmY